MGKNEGGRPTKLTQKFLDIANEVMNEDINAIILTDEELLMLINEQLVGREKVANKTFQDWKAGRTKSARGVGFRFLLKEAIIRQKKDLFNQFRAEPNQWQRWAWIIERKFDDWNIRQKIDADHTSKGEKIGEIRYVTPDGINNTQTDNQTTPGVAETSG